MANVLFEGILPAARQMRWQHHENKTNEMNISSRKHTFDGVRKWIHDEKLNNEMDTRDMHETNR